MLQIRNHDFTGRILFVLLIVISATSFGNFNERLLGDWLVDTGQRFLILGLWMAVAIISFRGKLARRLTVSDALFFSYLAFCFLSLLWSPEPLAGLQKILVLVAITAGIYAASMSISVSAYMDATRHGLFLTSMASIAICLLMPEVGLMDGYNNSGKWSGIFSQKQLLGITSAALLVLSIVHFFYARRWFHLVEVGVALVCIFGSESRGALVVAGVSLLVAMVAFLWPRARGWLTALIPLGVLGAFVVVIGFALGDYRSFDFFGVDTDLTSRTLIWNFALSAWKETPLLGVGYNAFWSEPVNTSAFRALYGWILPNFHNGYVASLVEIGLIGSFIFLLMAIFLGRGIFRKYAQWKGARSEAALLIAFLLMIIVINFTETFFMRATSGFQAFFFFAFFAVRNASPRPSAQRSGFNDCRVSSSSFER